MSDTLIEDLAKRFVAAACKGPQQAVDIPEYQTNPETIGGLVPLLVNDDMVMSMFAIVMMASAADQAHRRCPTDVLAEGARRCLWRMATEFATVTAAAMQRPETVQ